LFKLNIKHKERQLFQFKEPFLFTQLYSSEL
jgi:hypothetical protein